MARLAQTPKFKIQAPKRAAPMYVSAVNSEPQSADVPPQIPVRLERYEHNAPPKQAKRFWLHPVSGLLILGVDWFFFAPEAATFEVAAIITSPLAFLITTAGVFWVQRKKNHDSTGAALGKALLGGIVAAIPTSIGGTILGTAVLALSGLSSWTQRRGDK
jgi:hypothetical protein